MPDERFEICLAKQERYAVANRSSEQRLAWPPFILGEVVPCSVSQLLRSTGSDGKLWKDEDISDYTAKIAVGVIGAVPLAGSWIWTFGADNIVLNYNETVTSAQSKINAGSAMTTAGGVVLRQEGAIFIYTFNVAGARAASTATPDNLSPPSNVIFGIIQEGDVSHVEIGTFQLVQKPVALGTFTDNLDAAGGVVVTVATGAAGVNHKIRITLTGSPAGGSFNLTITDPTDSIPTDTTDAGLRAAVESLASVGAGNVSVLNENEGQWLLTFVNGKAATNMGASSGDFSALISRIGKVGNIDLQTAGVQLLLQGKRAVDAYIEIDVTPPGGSPRKYQQAVPLLNTLIGPDTTGPVPEDQFYTKAEIDALEAADTRWEFKSSGYTAVANDKVVTVVGGWTLTLPASPVAGDPVEIIPGYGADWSSSNITLARNGKTINGSASNLILNLNRRTILIYSGTTWHVG